MQAHIVCVQGEDAVDGILIAREGLGEGGCLLRSERAVVCEQVGQGLLNAVGIAGAPAVELGNVLALSAQVFAQIGRDVGACVVDDGEGACHPFRLEEGGVVFADVIGVDSGVADLEKLLHPLLIRLRVDDAVRTVAAQPHLGRRYHGEDIGVGDMVVDHAVFLAVGLLFGVSRIRRAEGVGVEVLGCERDGCAEVLARIVDQPFGGEVHDRCAAVIACRPDLDIVGKPLVGDIRACEGERLCRSCGVTGSVARRADQEVAPKLRFIASAARDDREQSVAPAVLGDLLMGAGDADAVFRRLLAVGVVDGDIGEADILQERREVAALAGIARGGICLAGAAHGSLRDRHAHGCEVGVILRGRRAEIVVGIHISIDCVAARRAGAVVERALEISRAACRSGFIGGFIGERRDRAQACNKRKREEEGEGFFQYLHRSSVLSKCESCLHYSMNRQNHQAKMDDG